MNNFDKILLKRSDYLIEIKGIGYECETTFDLKNIFQKRGQLSMYSAAEAHPNYGPWESGPMKMMNGNEYSLFVLVYVGVISLIVYIAFHFKAPKPTPPAPAHKKIPMITCTCLYHQIEKQRAEEELFRIGCIEWNDKTGKSCKEIQLRKYLPYRSPRPRTTRLNSEIFLHLTQNYFRNNYKKLQS